MPTETHPELLHQRLAATLSRFAAGFWEEPASMSLRLVAIIFVLVAVIGLVLHELNIGGRFSLAPVEALTLVFFAWVLSSKKKNQIIVGTFLIATFILSIVFLILPVEVLVDSFTTTMEKATAEQMTRAHASASVRAAQDSLSRLVNGHPGLETDFNLRIANTSLDDALKLLPGPADENLDFYEQLLQRITQTVSALLKKSAPFVFAMLMGLMGSAIAVSRQFVSNFEEKPAIWYLYRLLQGMIIALLIVYGLVAGMLSLGVNTGNQPIDIAKFDANKYFIGFVSALAGLFSEHAFAKLESVSAHVFGKTSNKGVEQERVGGPDITAGSNGEPATDRHDAGSGTSRT